MKDNCILITISAPSAGNLESKFTETFSPAQAESIYAEMARQTFEMARKIENADTVVCYTKDGKYPDLRWLDPEDPGFLVARDNAFIVSFLNSVRWCFDAGARKVVSISPFSPGMSADWISTAFTMLNERDIVAGFTRDGDWYLLGMNNIYLDLFKGYPWEGENKGATLSKKMKSAGLSVHNLPEFYRVSDYDTLEEWMTATGTKIAGVQLPEKPAPAAQELPQAEQQPSAEEPAAETEPTAETEKQTEPSPSLFDETGPEDEIAEKKEDSAKK